MSMKFDLSNAPKSNLSLKDQAIKCKNLADAIQRGRTSLKNPQLEDMMALSMNASLAIELYFKAILLDLGKKPHGHNLEILFAELPLKIKDELVSKDEMHDFILNIQELRDAYKVLRYFYEKGSLAVNAGFLIKLAVKLCAYTEYIGKQ